ncbi:MAG: response regulator, partial [Deltaproteobacteria bacterium]|nr:response regulator [Deltaproteobacteria bacterium]
GYILVIDDEEVIRTSAKITLEDMGYEVALASDGEKGVAAFEAEHDRINLVILDMIMPKLGGIDTFRALRKIDPEARIIIASGFSKGDSINTLKQEGLLGFISKPYRRTELEQLLAEVM